MKRITKIKILAIFCGIFLALLMVVALEGLAKFILIKKEKRNYSLFLNFDVKKRPTSFQHENWGSNNLVISYIDPHLGHAHDPNKSKFFEKLPGFVEYSSVKNHSNSNVLRIVTLGGSTTDPLISLFLNDPEADPESPHNWSQDLVRIFQEKKIAAKVYNGGVSGYSSSQELLKLIRDTIHLKPHIVLVLNGVNEIGFCHALKTNPLIHPYQKKLMDSIILDNHQFLLPNIKGLLKLLFRSNDKLTGANYGVVSESSSPVDNWHKNIYLSNAICNSLNIKYICFLQPTLGFGIYNASREERAWLKKKGPHYLKSMHKFYMYAKQLARKNAYCVDLTDIFAEQRNVYLDPRHLKAKGNRIIAEAIYREVMARKLLNAQTLKYPETVSSLLKEKNISKNKTHKSYKFSREKTVSYVHYPKNKEFSFSIGPNITSYQNELFVLWGSSKRDENDDYSLIAVKKSADFGVTWSPLQYINAPLKGFALSHGVFLHYKNNLYILAPQAKFSNNHKYIYPELHTVLFRYDRSTNNWVYQQITTGKSDNFWPLDNPLVLDNGTQVIGGIQPVRFPLGHPAIAIMKNLNLWTIIRIPTGNKKVWGETTVLKNDSELWAFIRSGQSLPRKVYFSKSEDKGLTWTEIQETKILSDKSKLFAATLSNKTKLLCRSLNSRAKIGIVYNLFWDKSKKISAKNEFNLMKNLPPKIRFPGRAKRPQWAYPSACVFKGNLYIVFHEGKENIRLVTLPLATLQTGQ